MGSDEQLFDFLAAAEDTGKQLDNLIKGIPNEMRETLATEYRKSPWLTTLPTAADRVEAAADRAEAAAVTLVRKAVTAGWVVCLAAVVVPLITWGCAYWQTWKLRQEQSELQHEQIELRREIKQLEGAIAVLKGGAGGGANLYEAHDGTWVFSLPPGIKIHQVGKDPRGREAVSYKLPE